MLGRFLFRWRFKPVWSQRLSEAGNEVLDNCLGHGGGKIPGRPNGYVVRQSQKAANGPGNYDVCFVPQHSSLSAEDGGDEQGRSKPFFYATKSG